MVTYTKRSPDIKKGHYLWVSIRASLFASNVRVCAYVCAERVNRRSHISNISFSIRLRYTIRLLFFFSVILCFILLMFLLVADKFFRQMSLLFMVSNLLSPINYIVCLIIIIFSHS